MKVHRSRIAKSALAVLVLSWLPLVLYIPFDFLRGGGGNPIGLGLLTIAGTFVSVLLAVTEGGRRLAQRQRARSHRAA